MRGSDIDHIIRVSVLSPQRSRSDICSEDVDKRSLPQSAIADRCLEMLELYISDSYP
jgi:hypothetical protein